ncbi:hypothetical protein [Streptomyces sp. SID3212]|uniref:hypothetical protein n=1 Tax=Streptomyces sp. SID3212 TaxID=2690259 RepID=UPI00136B9A98|nr:hypothetical protein [Streptomyces sp. SID3212]MYV58030.1 hypothetical protein [Streptomyces sp. SID3212]
MKWYEQERQNRRIALTVAERRNGNELHERAIKLREEFEDMSITQSVHLAAIQMGLVDVEMDDGSQDDEVHD